MSELEHPSAPRNKYYILNLVFLVGLLALFLNDHYLKFKFSNGLTGKLSDVAGIIIFPLLLAFLFPKLKQFALLTATALFVFWKSPLSQGLIDFYNENGFLQTSRIIDYTDLWVLVLLPIPYYIIKKIFLSKSYVKNVAELESFIFCLKLLRKTV